MIDTVDFKCPTTGQPCKIVEGYAAFLMGMMDNALEVEEVTKQRIGGSESSPHKITLASISEFKGAIADNADIEQFAQDVTAAARVNNCTGQIESREEIIVKPIHFMDLCPMMPVIFPEAN